MKNGFDSSSYGDAFADVYDEWYADVSDVHATVTTLCQLAGQGPFLELGVGTGRIAVPLAATGAIIVGVDSSASMLERLHAKIHPTDPATSGLTSVHGDMVCDLPDGPFALAFIAYNTLFSLGSHESQQRIFGEVARRLQSGGAFVVEAAVPDPERPPGGTVGVRSLDAAKVVLSVDVHNPAEQIVEGQFIEFTQEMGVRLRPWRIRYCTIEEVDAMAHAAGFTLVDRWENMNRDAFTSQSSGHVSVYRLITDGDVSA